MIIQQGGKKNVSDFIYQLNTRREEMDAERLFMSDTEFGLLYDVSCNSVIRYMGRMKKNIAYKSTIKSIPKDEINQLRKTKSDTFIANKYGCSLATINKNFGSRVEEGIPKYGSDGYKGNTNARKKPGYRTESVTSITRRLEAETRIIRKEDKWEYPVEKPYWDQSNTVELYNGPHKFLYQKLA